MKKENFSKKIVEWYGDHFRQLPWRNTQDAYKIWLSEIILQQTRVAQGLPYYEKFIQEYPDINFLASSREQQVLRLWQGLGYYTRARNLHKCAREIVKNFKGIFPSTFAELRMLPGIGDYTAAAIASFAFDERVAVIDGNVMRVLSRIFGIDKNIASPDGRKFFTILANELISHKDPATHNQAIMEFGALNCLPRNPLCSSCIFKRECIARQQDAQHLFPVKIKPGKVEKRYFNYFLLYNGKRLLMKERKDQDIWKGLYDFPLLEDRQSVNKISGYTGGSHIHVSAIYKHVLSHQLIHARFIEMKWSAENSFHHSLLTADTRWYTLSRSDKLPKPRLITRYLEDRGIL